MHQDSAASHTEDGPTGPALVGRAGEIGELLRTLAGVRARRPGIVLVEGASGMGRTALLDCLAGHGQAHGVTVLRAQCGAREQEFTFGLIRQLFRAASPADRLGKPPTAEWLFGMFEGLLQQVTRLAEQAPLLIVVDDFHHADPESAQWIDFLARRLNDTRILIALATDGDVPCGHRELTAELALSSLCRVIDLGPLPAADVAELTAATLGEPADEDFARECFRLSGGNPKLLALLLREFARTGIAPLTGDIPRAVDAASRVIATIVPQWMGRYRPELTTVAGMVALLGVEGEAGLLQQLTGLSHCGVTSSLTALERTGLLPVGGSRPAPHPAIRAVFSSHLSVAERSDIQTRAARVLFTQGASHERVADLILTSEPAEERWQVGVLRAAAAEATARGAADRAITYLRRAVQVARFAPERAALLVELGCLESRTDTAASVRHLDEGAHLTADQNLRARAVPLLADGLVQCGQAHRAVELLDALAAETGPDDTETLHRVRGLRTLAAVAAGLGGPPPAPGRLGTDRPTGEPVAALSGATPGERALLAAHALHTSLSAGDADEAAASAERTLRDFDAEHEPLWVAAVAIDTLRHADRLPSAGHWAAAVRSFDLGGRPPGMRAVLCAENALIRFQHGDLPGALAEGEEALRLLPGPHPYGGFVAAAAILPLVEADRLPVAHRIAEDPGVRSTPENWLWPYFLSARAQLRAAEGRTQAALHDLEQCGRLLARYGGDNPGRIAWRSQAALLYQQSERPKEARRLIDEELALARRWGAPITLAKSLRVAAIVGARPEAPRLMEESVSLLEGAAYPLELVRSLIAQGTALHAAGQTEAARGILRRALGLAQAGSAQRAAQEAYQRLLATGARPRRFSQVGPRALTSSQRRVVELAVQGLSNEDIASRLYVTQRTVEFHLTNAYRKLGITGRTDLARTFPSAMMACS